MDALLSRFRGQEGKYEPAPYVDTLLAAFLQNGRGPEHQPGGSQQRLVVQPLLEPLSGRELEVLHLMVQGNSNQEIARSLVLSIDTVKSHMSSIFSKLGVHTRVQAVARARALGLLSDEP